MRGWIKFSGISTSDNQCRDQHSTLFSRYSTEEWHRVVSVNLTGIYDVAQQAARRMIKAGEGVTINIGSTGVR
jgi:NAD(P)-dependent dehydrogenase (short-subunit alcohol dehydrogenase family)